MTIFVYCHEVHQKRCEGFTAFRADFSTLCRSPLKVKFIMLEMISFLFNYLRSLFNFTFSFALCSVFFLHLLGLLLCPLLFSLLLLPLFLLLVYIVLLVLLVSLVLALLLLWPFLFFFFSLLLVPLFLLPLLLEIVERHLVLFVLLVLLHHFLLIHLVRHL